MRSKFSSAVRDLVSRRANGAKKLIGLFYGMGNGLVLAIPPIKNGFGETVLKMKPDMALLISSYGDRPLPIGASALFLSSAYTIGRGRFAEGHALIFGGDAVLGLDLLLHNEMSSAASLLPGLAGSAFGAFYKPLEKSWGNAQNWICKQTVGNPKRLAGFFMSTTSVPIIISSYVNQNWALFAAGISWFIGNVISMALPQDTPSLPRAHTSSIARSTPNP